MELKKIASFGVELGRVQYHLKKLWNMKSCINSF